MKVPGPTSQIFLNASLTNNSNTTSSRLGPHAPRRLSPQVDMPESPPTEAVLRVIPAGGAHPGAQVRLAGDRYIFLEYGPMELDIALRVRWAPGSRRVCSN